MKIISGLDWIDHEIHYPDKIIDFCLNNEQFLRAVMLIVCCILYMCSKASNYKKSKVINKMLNLSKELNLVFK